MNASPPLQDAMVCPITIGRERELERLGRLMEQLQAGQGTTVLVTGEAGIGKSRLVAEARARGAALTALRSFDSAEPLLIQGD